MKKLGIFTTIFMTIFLLLGIGTSVFANEVEVKTNAVTFAEQFPDPIMATAMASQVGLGDVNEVITPLMIDTTLTLDISGNMTDLTGIDIFVNLERLNINAGQLTTLPDSIGNLSKLFDLYIQGTPLVSLPDSIGNLSNLQYLNINISKLESLPDSIGNLSKLQELFIQNSNLTSLPDSITNLNSLVIFNAVNNNVIDLPVNQFDFLNNLIKWFNLDGQTYEETLANKGYLVQDYSFAALPAYEQFTNYRVDFYFNLTKPNTNVVSITPQIIDGKIIIDGSFLDQVGEYKLESLGLPLEMPITTEYTHTFSVGVSTPVINLIGDNPLVINEGETYEEPGATASDEVDGDLTNAIEVSGTVDTAVPGTYTLTYTVTNSYEVSTSITRDVVVKSVPVIKLIGDSSITIEEGTAYEELGYMAKDTKDGDLTSKVVVSGMVDVNKPGTYILTYTVINSDGNTVSIDREIIVKEKAVVPDTGNTANKLPKTGGMIGLVIGATSLLGGSLIVSKVRKNK